MRAMQRQFGSRRRAVAAVTAFAGLMLASGVALAGAQVEERLAPSVATLMSQAISDRPVPTDYTNRLELRPWIEAMSPRLADKLGDTNAREEFLATVHYEATRAGLDPQLVLGVIQFLSWLQ